MKKLLFLISLVGITFLVGCGTAKTQIGPMKTFDATGFSIQYPATRAAQPNVFGAQLMLFSPQASGDMLREFVGIVSEKLPSDMSVDNYYTMAVKPQINLNIKDYTEISNESLTLNGVAAKKIVYKGSQVNMPLQRMQVLAIKNKVVYIITYTATQETFATLEQEATAIINSLVLK